LVHAVESEVSTKAKLPFLMPFGKKASVDLGPMSGVHVALTGRVPANHCSEVWSCPNVNAL